MSNLGLGGEKLDALVSCSLSIDVELTGRDRLGEELPDAGSCPKNVHFFRGLGGAITCMSSSKGIDPRRLEDGQASADLFVSFVGSKIALAVRGRESAPRRLGDGGLRRSLFGGLKLLGGVKAPPDTIELREFDTE